jgi:hypothetical protein
MHHMQIIPAKPCEPQRIVTVTWLRAGQAEALVARHNGANDSACFDTLVFEDADAFAAGFPFNLLCFFR